MPLSGIGFGEMLVIAMLVLIVFGPKRLPEITRSMGKAVREFKRGMNEIQRELEVADRQERWKRPADPKPAATDASAAAPAADAAATDAAGGAGDAAAGAPPATPDPVIAPPALGSDLDQWTRSPAPEGETVPIESAETAEDPEPGDQRQLFSEGDSAEE